MRYHYRMKKQISKRLSEADIRNVFETFCERKITTEMACEALGIGRTRFYELRTEYLRVRATGNAGTWVPGLSGGNHKGVWKSEVQNFLQSALTCRYPYAFAASEVLRKFGVTLHRSQVRKFAIANKLAPAPRKPRPPAHIRRWQRENVNELWQLDATCEAWWEGSDVHRPILNMLDDCSRMHVGCTMYASENLRAYYHFFKQAFQTFGLPLRIYVDQAGFFTNHQDEGLTQLEQRLALFGVSFILANSPEAKGKVERIHEVWQQRLTPYFKLNGITPDSDLGLVNEHLMSLRDHRNHHELHREIGTVPCEAWRIALSEGRSRIRRAPCLHPWWELAWATYTTTIVDAKGKVRCGQWTFPVQRPHGAMVWIAHHVDDSFTVLAKAPFTETYPSILWTNNKALCKYECGGYVE